ncbi:MAG TPA: glycosyltransferase family 2 protein [Acidobacteriota bacterium]|nr:glycosyltransferase family 2 protein [Acidobacteriota bacterium]
MVVGAVNTERVTHFGRYYLLAMLAGGVVLAVLIRLGHPLDWSRMTWRPAGGLLLAVAVGFILRSARRRIVFGATVAWHQAIAFEAMIQVVQIGSPWMPLRSFETEFLVRELGGASRERIRRWLTARDAGTWVTVTAGLAVAAALFGSVWSAAILGVLAAALLGAAAIRSGEPAAVLRSVLAGLVCWGGEGWLFVHFAAPEPETAVAWTMYLFFTGLAEVSPVPLGLGVLELPALLAWPGVGAALVPLLVFHAARLVVLAPLCALFLHRFKFTAGDLLSPAVILALRHSQRPPGGWPWPQGDGGDGPLISLVIPAYNEEKRLPAFLDSVAAYMGRCGYAMEVVVVDDGSCDGTADIMAAWTTRDARFRLLRQPSNQGKGAAVRRGMLAARGRYIVFADADGATPIGELDRFRPAMTENIEVVIGSRRLVSAAVRREREGFREMMGHAFYTVVNLLAVPGIRDTQCGFKMFRRDAARRLFAWSTETGWAFDVEILYLAQRVGYAVEEVAVNWRAVEGSKISPLADSLRMFLAVFRIRARQAGFLRHRQAGP